jgi:hypothetical protein
MIRLSSDPVIPNPPFRTWPILKPAHFEVLADAPPHRPGMFGRALAVK